MRIVSISSVDENTCSHQLHVINAHTVTVHTSAADTSMQLYSYSYSNSWPHRTEHDPHRTHFSGRSTETAQNERDAGRETHFLIQLVHRLDQLMCGQAHSSHEHAH